MKLFRSITLNEGENIDIENIGNSWTLCDVFAENHANDYNRFAQKDGYVIVSIDVEVEDIDLDNTLFAMENRENEFEVVVNDMDIEMIIHQIDGLDSFQLGETLTGNTGSNDFEDYCTEYEGDLKIENLIELINEF